MRATILCTLVAVPVTSFVPQVNRFPQQRFTHAMKMRRVTLASSPAPESDAIMSDDPMIVRLEEECARINGINWNSDVGLMQLLNPSKVVNLERELEGLKAELANFQGDAEARAELEATIDMKNDKKVIEMRGVMRDWLKALFVWQSVLSVVACGAVAYDAVPFAGHLELYVQVLGFWGIWLFTIPSLRSRKPGGIWGMSAPEKSALDLAFLLTPVANLALPSLHCKDPALIFWANLVVTGACYAWFFVGPGQNAADSDDKNSDASLPEPIKFALQALDFGGGSERGMSQTTREKFQAREQERAKQKTEQPSDKSE